jgi:hypothetical protein
MNDLKPCPYCGDNYWLIDKCKSIAGTPLHQFICPCGASTPARETKEEAIKAANERRVKDPLAEAMEFGMNGSRCYSATQACRVGDDMKMLIKAYREGSE